MSLAAARAAGDGAGPATPLAVPIPFRDPTSAFAPLAHLSWAALLDSAAEHPARGRFAYIAVDPMETLLLPAGGTANPFALLRAKLIRWKTLDVPSEGNHKERILFRYQFFIANLTQRVFDHACASLVTVFLTHLKELLLHDSQ